MASQSVIEVHNLHKSFHSASGVTEVLKGINLQIAPKEFAILYGPSGCGKSTLLHHIVGLETPTDGEVYIGNTNLSALSQEQRAVFRSHTFGMVYQVSYWVNSLNVWENVAMPLFIQGISEGKARKKAVESLDRLEMGKYANVRPSQLSGGEQQRVGMARALINDPVIIVADEPTGNLDTHAADTVMGLLQQLSYKQGKTVLMVTHNLIYLPMATKVISMRDGQVINDQAGAKEQIKEELQSML